MSYLFAVTGVQPPATAPAQLAALAQLWSGTASAMQGVRSDVSASMAAVAGANQGPTAMAFAAAVAGQGSGLQQLEMFAHDGAAMAQGCVVAAGLVRQVALSMRVAALRGETEIHRLVAAEGVGSAVKALAVVQQTRAALTHLESQGQQAVTAALAAVHFTGATMMLPQDGTPSLPTEVDGYGIGPPARPDIAWDEDFEFDTKSPTPGDYISRAKWEAMLRGGQLHPGLDDATVMYAHYLAASGEPRGFDLEEAIAEDPGMASNVQDEIVRAAAAADELAAGRDTFRMSGPAHATSHYPQTENWQKTVGAHQQWSSADVTVEDGIVTMRVTVHAEDRYNFNRGQSDIATGAPDDDNGRFQEIGWARSFDTSGEVTREISWPQGDPPPAMDLEGSPERNRFGNDSREDRPDR